MEIAKLEVAGARRVAGRERTVLSCSSSKQSSIAPVRDGGSEVELGLLLASQ